MSTQAHILAAKIRFLLDGKFVDHMALAEACGVSRQAVTGWKKTGRVAKNHLPIIAGLAGVTTDWLVNDTPPDAESVVRMRAPKPRWPFQSVTWERYLALSRDDRDDLDARIGRIVSAYEATDDGPHRKSPAGRAAR